MPLESRPDGGVSAASRTLKSGLSNLGFIPETLYVDLNSAMPMYVRVTFYEDRKLFKNYRYALL